MQSFCLRLKAPFHPVEQKTLLSSLLLTCHSRARPTVLIFLRKSHDRSAQGLKNSLGRCISNCIQKYWNRRHSYREYHVYFYAHVWAANRRLSRNSIFINESQSWYSISWINRSPVVPGSWIQERGTGKDYKYDRQCITATLHNISQHEAISTEAF